MVYSKVCPYRGGLETGKICGDERAICLKETSLELTTGKIVIHLDGFEPGWFRLAMARLIKVLIQPYSN
jgi:hypothetical protein